MCLNHSRKLLLPAGVHGAYTNVSIHELLLNVEVISTDRAKSFSKIWVSENRAPFHATRIPLEALTEGLKVIETQMIDVSEESQVNYLLFSFLQANYITFAFNDLVLDGVPFFV
jgi:hypothetical protein